MKKRNLNIAILALFQLLIFAAPVIIKAGHLHEPDPVYSWHVQPGKAVSKEIRCLICTFEFVNYNVPFPDVYFHFQRACAIDLNVSIEKAFNLLLTYFSLRAPPAF